MLPTSWAAKLHMLLNKLTSSQSVSERICVPVIKQDARSSHQHNNTNLCSTDSQDFELSVDKSVGRYVF